MGCNIQSELGICRIKGTVKCLDTVIVLFCVIFTLYSKKKKKTLKNRYRAVTFAVWCPIGIPSCAVLLAGYHAASFHFVYSYSLYFLFLSKKKKISLYYLPNPLTFACGEGKGRWWFSLWRSDWLSRTILPIYLTYRRYHPVKKPLLKRGTGLCACMRVSACEYLHVHACMTGFLECNTEKVSV